MVVYTVDLAMIDKSSNSANESVAAARPPVSGGDQIDDRMQSVIHPSIALVLIFLVLFSAALVAAFAPDLPKGRQDLIIKSHKSRIYFLQAKEMVRPFIRRPIENWSKQFLDTGTGTLEIGHGVWYATGTVQTQEEDGRMLLQTWNVFFVAETKTPIFCRVGNVHLGDVNRAMEMAHVKPTPAPGH